MSLIPCSKCGRVFAAVEMIYREIMAGISGYVCAECAKGKAK